LEGLLAPGNTVQVELPLGAPQKRLSVPRDALIIRAEGLYVYRVDREQRAERIDVKAGVADGDWVAVEGGLSAGDQVVVRGGELLRGEEKLQIVGVFEEQTQAPSKTAERPRT
jgi:multidrug efflux pump subunit AcrA (membrane-fusion protein)